MQREFHYFVLTDYEKEEEFLRKKHKQGYKLVKVTLPGFYYFEKCEPEDVVYRLDFNPQLEGDKESYIQMYRDYGWEYIQDLNEYSYFRKSAEIVEEQETTIFSDNASKLDMLTRIFMKRMLPILVVALVCTPSVITALTSELGKGIQIGITSIVVIILALYIWIIGRCLVGFWNLKKKYSK